MKKSISESIKIPEGISCEYTNRVMKCSSGSNTLERKIVIPDTEVKISKSEISFECKKGNKNQYKSIMSTLAHLRNLFSGLQDKFVYHLESCSVHFPMTIKVEGNKVAINNFLGEKTPRYAKIISGSEVKVEGQKITVTSSNRDAAGQTAANLEKATKLVGRDRRIFQDGVYIVQKPGRNA